ncbi:MAG: hypothetical protein OJF59_002262 [Cytophagales bacterium]|jgi:hypothetical protein|nr:hypothetical protein [Bacteroidota bacterium]MBS1981556.1 hypothetical protein [Bacteroidota bacterium]WHZ08508.1 MAG: hypothetical protein OJF59_002262 [Cytophagales bacterium]
MKKTINYLFVGFSALVALTLVQCSKSSSSLPAINGYTSSDAVAASNLVSYFPFDGNANDSKNSSTTATAVGVTFVKGLRGEAYQGATGAYATLAPSAAYSSLPSYSVSMWYKLSAQPNNTSGPQGLFFLSGTQSNSQSSYQPVNGTLLIFEIENHAKTGSDSLQLHHGFTNLGSAGWQGFTMNAYDTSSFKGWSHIVTTYDGSSSTYVIYADGMPISNQSAFGTSTSSVLYQGNSGAAATTGQGNLSWSTDPPKAITIGTWPAGVYGVSPTLGSNGCFLGKMDELRIYNKALSPVEVGSLYQLGSAGR